MGDSKKAKILRRTYWGGGLALALAALLFWLSKSESGLPVALAGGLVCLGGCHELSRMGALGALGLRLPLMLAGVVAALAALASVPDLLPGFLAEPLGTWLLPWLSLWLLGLPLVAALVLGKGPVRGALAALLGLWACFAFGAMHQAYTLLGLSAFISLLVLSKVGDIAGYYFGNAFGKTHPFKGISPGKTTEGCLGSLGAGVLVAVLLAQAGWLGPDPLWGGAAFGLVINLAAQAGDLFESLIKRRSGVKDSGTWFGPSGGVLDLVDSFLFTVPAALLTAGSLLGIG